MMNLTWKSARDNWHVLTALCALVIGAATSEMTLQRHSLQMDEMKSVQIRTSDKVDARFDSMNSKLDKISDNTSYVRGKLDEMDRRSSPDPVASRK